MRFQASRARSVISALSVLTISASAVASCPSFYHDGKLIRGDANNDGSVNVSDPQFILDWIHGSGAAPPCNRDSADVNDNGLLDATTDAIVLLSFLFSGGLPPPEPFPTPDCDTTIDNIENCTSSNGTSTTINVTGRTASLTGTQGFGGLFDVNLVATVGSTKDIALQSYNVQHLCTPRDVRRTFWEIKWSVADQHGITEKASRHCQEVYLKFVEQYEFGALQPICNDFNNDVNELFVHHLQSDVKLIFNSNGINFSHTPTGQIARETDRVNYIHEQNDPDCPSEPPPDCPCVVKEQGTNECPPWISPSAITTTVTTSDFGWPSANECDRLTLKEVHWGAGHSLVYQWNRLSVPGEFLMLPPIDLMADEYIAQPVGFTQRLDQVEYRLP